MRGTEERRPAYEPPFNTAQAAEWLGVSKKQVLDYARAGLIGRKVGGTWFFSQRQLAELAGVETNGPRGL